VIAAGLDEAASQFALSLVLGSSPLIDDTSRISMKSRSGPVWP